MATLYQIYDSMILKPYLDDIILCYHCKIIFFFIWELPLESLWGGECSVLQFYGIHEDITISLQDDNYYNLQITTEKKSDAFLKIVQFYFFMCEILLNTMSVACRHLKMYFPLGMVGS